MKTAGDILREKKSEMIFVDEETTIAEAVSVMVKHKIGAILIKRDGKVIGIWTERDLLKNTAESGFDCKASKIKDYMSTGLKSAPVTDSVYMLMDKFLGLRLRHLLIEKNEEYIGMLSAGDIMKETLNQKTSELKHLNAIVSWDYYENWMWDK
ncbi:MAG: CBS domain-containing protein [bacterium]|nr:CBS domain-containing protein [bacterium]